MFGATQSQRCKQYKSLFKRLQQHCNRTRYPNGQPQCGRAKKLIARAEAMDCGWVNARWWRMVDR